MAGFDERPDDLTGSARRDGVSAGRRPSNHNATPASTDARTREKPRFSTSQATMGSNSEIPEVQAANTSSTKNSTPNS